jgi:hypothetical protein
MERCVRNTLWMESNGREAGGYHAAERRYNEAVYKQTLSHAPAHVSGGLPFWRFGLVRWTRACPL